MRPECSRSRRSATCSRMSATSRLVDLPHPLEERDRGLGLVGVDVDLEGRLVADDEDRVAEALEPRQVLARRQAGAGDDEVRAVAEAAVLVVGQAEARRLLVVDLGHRGRVAAQAGDDAGEDQDQAVAAGVDDARVAQHLELLGGALDRPLAVLDRPLEHLGEDRVLLLVADPAGRGAGGRRRGGRAGGRSSAPSRGRRSASSPRPARAPSRRRRRRRWRRRRRRAPGRSARRGGWRAPRRRRGRSG